ncbi:hypothetical protein [Nitrosomonas communis]|nr:hypothetical protein [Nitrosomonas communis]
MSVSMMRRVRFQLLAHSKIRQTSIPFHLIGHTAYLSLAAIAR